MTNGQSHDLLTILAKVVLLISMRAYDDICAFVYLCICKFLFLFLCNRCFDVIIYARWEKWLHESMNQTQAGGATSFK